MTVRPIRVIKVGGSLFSIDGLADVLCGWLATQPVAENVLIAGGGRWADAVREADRRHSLGEEAAHWLSIGAMGLTAQLLAALLPEARLVRRLEELAQPKQLADGRRPVVFDAEHFLRHQEPSQPGTRLPPGWHVTSDSIAARVAVVLGARELVLLKSIACPNKVSRAEAAARGYVDGFFPTASEGIGVVRWVNLRQTDYPEMRWDSC